jgi:hypothetical protein
MCKNDNDIIYDNVNKIVILLIIMIIQRTFSYLELEKILRKDLEFLNHFQTFP